ncbi:MAG: hypothetical protein QG655_12 [Actinomycetota bacterium]|nr:hypothetical protein [Actinomycetota bacterium]
MTATYQQQQQPVQADSGGLHPAGHVRLAEQVRVAVLFRGRQTDVTLPANSAVAAVVDSLGRVLQTRDLEDGETGLRTADEDGMISAGLLTLTLIDGRPLDRTQSLAQQAVADGDLLILSVIDPEVEFTPIVEAPSSAVAVLNRARYATVTEATTRMVAGAVGAATVLTAVAVLALSWWRGLEAGQDWNLVPAVVCVVLAAGLLVSGTLVWWRRRDRVTATALWLPALVALTGAAVMGLPGRPGTWHVMFASGVVLTAAAVLWRLSRAPKGVLAAVAITAAAALAMSVVHVLGAPMTYVWVGAVAVALWVVTNGATLAGLMAGIPVPPFPTVTGKDTFDDAEHIAQEALVAAEHHGTPSVSELARAAAAANTYLTALLAAAALFFVGGAFAVVSPGRGRWVLATVYVVIVGTILVLRGRAFTTRAQAVLVVATGLAMYAAVAVKYTVAWDDAAVSYWVAGLILGLGVLGLIIAATVPQRSFSPVFRKLVEWLEYLMVVLVPVLAVWLLNVFTLVRNR